MQKKALALGAVLALAACDGFKEAMTAHVDVAARAGSQELSVNRLADLLGSANVPLNKDVAKTLANYWVDVQLLGKAAADGDTLNSQKILDDVMWSAVANYKARKWYDQVSKTFPQPSAAENEARYNSGELLAARHILLQTPPTGLSTGQEDAIRKKAETLRAQATPANFARLAAQNSDDPGSKQNGGALGVFPKGAMVPEFEKALVALKPGEISPVVKTQFGYHIIYRQPYSEVGPQFAQQADQRSAVVAESTYFAKLEQGANVKIKPDAPKLVKGAAADLDAHRNDKAVVATTNKGDFTVGRLVRYVAALPPQARIAQQLQAAPDSLIPDFVRSMVGKDLFLKQADSAKVAVDTADLAAMRRSFTEAVVGAWNSLAVAPAALADSAKSSSDKQRLAATRIDSYVDRVVRQEAPFVQVPQPIEEAARSKYEYKINEAGIDRAVERAVAIRASRDSARAARQPASAVPMPGGAGASAGP
ncbi:MAG: peptidylprolyl isomerase, partial [Gemmatimonadaceae bacterium]